MMQDDIISYARFVDQRMVQHERKMEQLGQEFRDMFSAFMEEWKQQ